MNYVTVLSVTLDPTNTIITITLSQTCTIAAGLAFAVASPGNAIASQDTGTLSVFAITYTTAVNGLAWTFAPNGSITTPPNTVFGGATGVLPDTGTSGVVASPIIA